MSFYTVGELLDSYCTIKSIYSSGRYFSNENPYYEDFSTRRYNYSPSEDRHKIRLIFLRSVLLDPNNKTLRRGGRFIWCKNILYNGRDDKGMRTISFTVDNGNKRFVVAEDECLCIPSKSYVNNNQLFRTKDKTFFPFSSVFSYDKAIKMMSKGKGIDPEKMKKIIKEQKPFRPGTLVGPKKGYFYPMASLNSPYIRDEKHPCGIILGESFLENKHINREFYRVRFGDITYEKVHPIQMEIINEV